MCKAKSTSSVLAQSRAAPVSRSAYKVCGLEHPLQHSCGPGRAAVARTQTRREGSRRISGAVHDRIVELRAANAKAIQSSDSLLLRTVAFTVGCPTGINIMRRRRLLQGGSQRDARRGVAGCLRKTTFAAAVHRYRGSRRSPESQSIHACAYVHKVQTRKVRRFRVVTSLITHTRLSSDADSASTFG